MPKRRRSTPFRRKFKRRRFKRRIKKRKRRLPIGGFPKSKVVRLRYVQQIKIDAHNLTGAPTAYVFRANSLYDPDFTSTVTAGHQPSNWDVWSPLYDHYTVLGSKIKVSPVNPTGDYVSPSAYMGILLSDTGTRAEGLLLQDIMEQRLCKYSRVPVGRSTAFGRNDVNAFFSAKKFFGKSRASILGDDTYKGGASSNPEDGAFFEVWCGSVAGNDPAEQNFLVEIEYIAHLSEPKPAIYS